MNNIELLTEVRIEDRMVKVFREPELPEKDAHSILDHFMEKLSNGQIVNKKGEPVKTPSMHFIIIRKDHTVLCGHKSDDQPCRLVHAVLKDIKPEELNKPTPMIGEKYKQPLEVQMRFTAI